jgi:hypothetical protein
MRATTGFRGVRCLKCFSEYETAINQYSPRVWSPVCVMRAGANLKCGGELVEVKNSGPVKAKPEELELASEQDGADLEMFLEKLPLKIGDRNG